MAKSLKCVGSTLIYLPRETIDLVFKNIKNVSRDIAGQYIVPCHHADLPDITVKINQHLFTITSKHYVITSGAVKQAYIYIYIHIYFVLVY